MSTTDTTPVSKEAAILNDTEQKRQELYDKVLTGELDPKVVSAAAKLLDGRDKQVISQQRIEAEKQSTTNTVEAAKELIKEMRKQIQGADLRRTDGPQPVKHVIPADPAPGQAVNPGATTVGIAGEKFDDFTERMKKGEDFIQKEGSTKPAPPVST